MSYLRLWIWWVSWTLLLSIFFGSALSSIMSMVTFFNSSATSIDKQTFDALVKIAFFWFPFTWALSYIIVLMISIKKLFYRCFNGFELTLYTCSLDEQLKPIFFLDIIKIWRRWLFITIWIVSIFTILTSAAFYLLNHNFYEWFNIYYLVTFIYLSGLFSFNILVNKTPQIKIQKC